MNHPSGNMPLTRVVPALNLTPRITIDSSVARARRRPGWLWGLLGSGLTVGVAAGVFAIHRARAEASRAESIRELPLIPVSRVDFQTKMLAAGRVESHRKTMIQCDLERLVVSNEGRTVVAEGGAQVIEVIPEGTMVHKGDILCRLSSNDYEELVRTQLMKTEQSRAALEQAQLNFDVAELAVGEYRDGLRQQNIQVLEGQIALAESDLERATDRLRWTADMLIKGYVPVAQKATAERTVAQLKLKLATGRWNLANFNKYGNPRTLKELLSEVEKRRYEVTANTQRVARLEERLGHYRKMVEFCTIRSPHDGMVIYAVDPWRRNAPRLEAGVEVRQQQQLFYLPDLSEMEVVTYLHESVAQQVQSGLAAQVRIEGLGNQVLSGKVAEIAPLPVTSPVWTTSDEVKYFLATIKLASVPAGLLPGMSAEVDIDLNRSQDVLAVPSEAVASEQGRDICYVAGQDGLQRRQVTVGRSNHNLLEVTRGLAEGEEVVINPTKVDALGALLTAPSEGPADGPENPIAEPSGFGSGPVSVE